MASRDEVLAKKRKAYLDYKSGVSVQDIASELGLSERMVYRYIDEFDLVQLRAWKTRFEESLSIVSMSDPVSKLVKLIKARK